MPKRMRDTETYKDRFVKGLPPDYKHLWFYILDDCDHAGIWRVDLEGASLYTGCQFTEAKALELLASKVEVVNQDYWFIPAFLKFQYGTTANEKAGVVISAHKRLTEFNLQDRLAVGLPKGKDTLSTPSKEGQGTPKNKSKDKSKDKNLDEAPFLTFWNAYPIGKKVGKDAAAKAWIKAKPVLADVLAALHWQKRSWDWTKEGGQFVPHPSTYLNQGRWKDENPEAPKANKPKAPVFPAEIKVVDETAQPLTEQFKANLKEK